MKSACKMAPLLPFSLILVDLRHWMTCSVFPLELLVGSYQSAYKLREMYPVHLFVDALCSLFDLTPMARLQARHRATTTAALALAHFDWSFDDSSANLLQTSNHLYQLVAGHESFKHGMNQSVDRGSFKRNGKQFASSWVREYDVGCESFEYGIGRSCQRRCP